MREAAVLIGNLVPGAVINGRVVQMTQRAFERLSTGQRAEYEIALDLWEGGTLARFVNFATMRDASVFMGALTVALGNTMFPMEEGVSRQ
jgi:hypothetical protein